MQSSPNHRQIVPHSDGEAEVECVRKLSWAADVTSADHRFAITDLQCPILHTKRYID
jgi:hypothetical protein